jgi:predicted nicotinamide N-methyase
MEELFHNVEEKQNLQLVEISAPKKFRNSERSIRLSHAIGGQAQKNDITGHKLWPSSALLVEHALANPDRFVGKRVLELGSGTGFVGIALAKWLLSSSPPSNFNLS